MKLPDDINLSISEKLAFEEFRRRNVKILDQSISDENYYLYRFLKAREFDVDAAETMLRASLQWRKKNGVDTILEDYTPPEVLQMNFGKAHIGYDKYGSPLFYFAVGRLDIRGIFNSVKEVDMVKMFIKVTEMAAKILEMQSKKLNKPVKNYTLILNMDGFSFAAASDKKFIEVLIRLAQIQQENYPERLKAMYVLNASYFFSIPFSIIKHFIASSILNKIHIFGMDGWIEELLKAIDANQLPAFLGGKRTDPDGNTLCHTFVNHGGIVDEKYYIHKSRRTLANSPGVKKLVLARASFSEIVLDIDEDGSLIEWEFETKTKDIGFGLFYKEMVDTEEKVTELVPLQRLDTEQFAETGIYKCERSGSYVMLFDNSYSWIRSKEIYYRATVVRPKDHDAKIQENNKINKN